MFATHRDTELPHAVFAEAPVGTFEPVIREEARYILLFANWSARYRRMGGYHARPQRPSTVPNLARLARRFMKKSNSVFACAPFSFGG